MGARRARCAVLWRRTPFCDPRFPTSGRSATLRRCEAFHSSYVCAPRATSLRTSSWSPKKAITASRARRSCTISRASPSTRQNPFSFCASPWRTRVRRNARTQDRRGDLARRRICLSAFGKTETSSCGPFGGGGQRGDARRVRRSAAGRTRAPDGPYRCSHIPAAPIPDRADSSPRGGGAPSRRALRKRNRARISRATGRPAGRLERASAPATQTERQKAQSSNDAWRRRLLTSGY